jgi:transcriptional regulator with XRE-family HTH domain
VASPGWKAAGRIEPLWKQLDPPTRERLADLTGIRAETLSGYNTGRLSLGMDNAVRIANACNVSVYDLGAPGPAPDSFAMALLGLLVTELRRTAHQADPVHLRELAAELHGLADDFQAVAAGRSDDGPL